MSAPTDNAIRRWWWGQQFEPGPAALLLNPFFFARRGLRAGLGEFLPGLTGEVLDVGCGRQPYRHLVPASRYVGVDMDTPVTRALGVADIFYDGRKIPVADAAFDAVLCSQVLEHVFAPEEFLHEIIRVLRPGGTLLLATPFSWDEHEQPHDFARYSSFGLRALLARNGFELVAQRKTCADFRAVVQLGTGYLYKVTRTRHRVINGLAQLLLIAPVNIFGGLLALLLPGNADFYLDNIVLARKSATGK
jgi:SAM-dependent methyltransferase